jgi:hypothetical protein
MRVEKKKPERRCSGFLAASRLHGALALYDCNAYLFAVLLPFFPVAMAGGAAGAAAAAVAAGAAGVAAGAREVAAVGLTAVACANTDEESAVKINATMSFCVYMLISQKRVVEAKSRVRLQ